MVANDPSAHDSLYIDVWGPAYRSHPQFLGWLEKVRKESHRTISSHKNDLRDRLSARKMSSSNQKKGW